MVELPKYSGSWGSVDTTEEKENLGKGGKNEKNEKRTGQGLSEKELPALPDDAKERVVKLSSYYDDASDEEEARDVYVKSGMAKTSSRRIEYNRRLS